MNRKQVNTKFTEDNFDQEKIAQELEQEIQHNQEKLYQKAEKSDFYKKASAKAITAIASKHRMLNLLSKAYLYFSKNEDKGSISKQVKEKFSSLIRLIRAIYRKEYKDFPWGSLVKATATLIYLVSPIDFIPDFLPFLGLADDFALISWVIGSLAEDITKFEQWELAQGKTPTQKQLELDTDLS